MVKLAKNIAMLAGKVCYVGGRACYVDGRACYAGGGLVMLVERRRSPYFMLGSLFFNFLTLML